MNDPGARPFADAAVRGWFDGHRTLRAVVETVLEGALGRIVLAGDPPVAARLDLGCYAIFAGAAGASPARRLVEEVVAPVELIGPDDQAWRDLFTDVHAGRLADRPMRTFTTHAFDRAALRAFATRLPEGCELRPLDAALASGLGPELEPHGLQTHPTPEALAASGGFGIVRDGMLVSQASAYARSRRRLEIAVATRPEARGLGLARAAAAALVVFCLDEGLSPEWSAANPISKRLAVSLGYRLAALCDVRYLERRA